MEEVQAREGAYMTVGEVARRAGVTVRSVQYYDQQGILSPSAKGAHNERLYTPADLDRLFCVLCLKYAGLSLGQIRELVAGGSAAADSAPAVASPGRSCGEKAGSYRQGVGEADADEPRRGGSYGGEPPAAMVSGRDPLADVFSQAIAQTERDFAALLHRHAVLNSLRQAALDAEHAGAQPDWRAMAAGIADEAPVPGEGRRCMVQAWHGVIAEAVGLMRRREPLDSPASLALARKVAALRKADAHKPPEERFSLMEDALGADGGWPGGGAPDGMGPGFVGPTGGADSAGPAAPGGMSPGSPASGEAFEGLRHEMAAYLDRLAAALKEADG